MSAETWLGWHQFALGLAVVALVVLAAWLRNLAEEAAADRWNRDRLRERCAALHAENDALRAELDRATLPGDWIDGEIVRVNGEGGIQGRG